MEPLDTNRLHRRNHNRNIRTQLWKLVLLTISTVGACISGYTQIEPERCNDERACRLESKAESVIDTEPSGLAKAAILLTDAIFHNPSLRADQKLRECLELLRPTRKIADFDGSVDLIATSRNGEWVAVASDDNSVSLFRASTWEKLKTWRYAERTTVLVFSPDSKYLASAGADHYARTFDVANQLELAHVENKGIVRTVAFSADGLRVACGGDGFSALVFNTADGSEVISLPHSGRVTGLQFSPDGKQLITSDTKGTVRVFEMSKNLKPQELAAGAPIRKLAVSSDGAWIAAATDSHKLCLWYKKEARPAVVMRGTVSTLAFDLDDRWLSYGTDDGTFRVFNLNTGENLFGDKTVNGAAEQVAFSPDRRWLAVASSDKMARIYDAATGSENARITHRKEVRSFAFTTDSRYLITGSADGVLAISPILSSTERFRYRNNDISTAAISPVMRLAAIATYSHGVSLFKLGDETSRTMLNHKRPVFLTNFSTDGKLLLTADDLFVARVFAIAAEDRTSMDIPLRQVPHQSWINAGAFSHDGTLFSVGDDSGAVRIFKTERPGVDFFSPIPYLPSVRSLVFSRNNQFLAVGSDDGTAHIYRRENGGRAELWNETPIRPLTSRGKVIALEFNHDGSRLAFGSSSGLLRICKVEDGSILRELSYSEGIVALAFTMDDSRLVVALGNGAIHIVATDTGEELGAIQNHEHGVRAIAIDEDDKSLWTLSIGDSDDLVSRFVTVHQFAVYATDLIRQSCTILKNFPADQAWAQAALGEPDHHVCK
jgi:WD40 repeat protein